MSDSLLTIIIPCYKESNRLPEYLGDIHKNLNNLEVKFIIVDDGSPLEDFIKMESLIKPYLNDKINLLRYERNLGKGGAISFGISNTQSEYVGFLDADGSIPFYEVKNLIDNLHKNREIDMLVASRILMLGKKIERNFLRHLIGRLFSTFLNILFPMNVYDSQCGFKIFSKNKYTEISKYITDYRWLWDTQVLILFYLFNFKIIEYPIDWKEKSGSKLVIFVDALKMLWGLLEFKKKINKYGFKRI